MKIKARDRNKEKSIVDGPANEGDSMIEELFENEKSVGFKAKNGGFPFKGKGAKDKATAQAKAFKAKSKSK